MRFVTLASLVVLAAACATAGGPRPASAGDPSPPYHRFWRGFQRADVDTARFVSILNSKFIPATIAVGAGRGLLAYQPVVPAGGAGIPEELALVTYASEALYREIRATPEGQAYAESHWELFDKSRSKSAVPVGYAGVVENGGAYDLRPGFRAWAEAETSFAFVPRPTGGADLEAARRFAARVAADSDGFAGLVLLVSDEAVYVYAAWPTALARTTGERSLSAAVAASGFASPLRVTSLKRAGPADGALENPGGVNVGTLLTN